MTIAFKILQPGVTFIIGKLEKQNKCVRRYALILFLHKSFFCTLTFIIRVGGVKAYLRTFVMLRSDRIWITEDTCKTVI